MQYRGDGYELIRPPSHRTDTQMMEIRHNRNEEHPDQVPAAARSAQAQRD